MPSTLLQCLEKEPLTDGDMQSLLPGVPLHIYQDEATWDDDLAASVDAHGRAILYYPTRQVGGSFTSGHWLGLIVWPGKEVEVFDPYGGHRDPWYLDRTFATGPDAYHVSRPLLKLAAASVGLPLDPMEHRCQSWTPTTATCGRHVVVRLVNYAMDNETYTMQLKRACSEAGCTADTFVTRLTDRYPKPEYTAS